ncbi:hypothetical protein A2U01_0075410, partial [Trifolium medium]|nr:hypothetical protein [Trifolium medium]
NTEIRAYLRESTSDSERKLEDACEERIQRESLKTYEIQRGFKERCTFAKRKLD